MPAETGSRIEGSETQWLTASGFDNFPDVNVHAVCKKLQLIYQRYVDRTINIFQQLDQLSCTRRRNRNDSVDNLLV